MGRRSADQPADAHDSIIYEMHVAGLTRSPTSGATHPGTFAAVTEKIPYLQALGITAAEAPPCRGTR